MHGGFQDENNAITHLQLLVMASSTALHLSLVLAQPSGFISIDCGGNRTESYIDSDTNITYISDSQLMEFGEIKSVDPNYIYDRFPVYLRNLRTFTKGNRTCYHLSVAAGSKYLLRTSFFYGNYDGLEFYPQFDLYLENTFVHTVFTSRFDWQAYEFIVKPIKNNLTLCLCKTNEVDNPFISVIELRPIPDEIYPVVNAILVLKMLYRINFGARNQEVYRYPDDVFDRFWFSSGLNGLVSINTTKDVSLENDLYSPPLIVMQTGINANGPYGIYWNASIPQSSSLFMCIHFAELEYLPINETRQFSITVNQEPFAGPNTPSYLNATNVCSSGISGPQDVNYVLLTPTGQSNLSPILNAAEVYAVVQLSSSATNDGDVNFLLDIKKKYGISKPWSGDPCLPLNYAWEGLVCSNDNTSPLRVISLDLSNSGLNGEIPTSLSDLTALRFLNLAGNNLTGSIPDFLANLTQLKELRLEGNKLTGSIPDFFVNLTQLTWLDLSDNNLNGSVPDALFRKARDGNLFLRISRNNELCSSGICDALSRSKSRPVINNGLIVLAVILSLLVVVLAILIMTKKRKRALDQKCTTFTFSEVIQMTDNFKQKIGEGGYGPVFHGYLRRQHVAVKILAEKSKQGSKEFQTEIALLSRVHHRNLVSFLGYCEEADKKILIYEFLPNGNLREIILGNKQISLAWEQRLQIALDAAQGLEYLHSFCKPAIIHRDVKSANILLNDNLEAKLADFGLSKSDIPDGASHVPDGASHVSSVVAGTPGYLDPEYYFTGWLNEKSDVYSFGVVLLELISGERPVIVEPSGTRVHLAEWVREHILKGNHEKVADPNFHGKYNVPSFWRVVHMALECTRGQGTERPRMNTVVTELREAIAMCNAMSDSEDSNIAGQQKLEASISSNNNNAMFHDKNCLPAARKSRSSIF